MGQMIFMTNTKHVHGDGEERYLDQHQMDRMGQDGRPVLRLSRYHPRQARKVKYGSVEKGSVG